MFNKISAADLVEKLISGEKTAARIVSRLTPWLTPVPTAYMVYRAATIHLSWPMPVAAIAAAIVESVGIAATFITIDMAQYNGRRAKDDQPAPTHYGMAIVAGYTVAALALTVLMDIAPQMSSYAGLIFVGLSLAGVMVIGLNHNHDRLLEAQAQRIAAEREAAEIAAAEKLADKQRREEARRLDKAAKMSNGQPPDMSRQTAAMSTDKPDTKKDKPPVEKADRLAELEEMALAGHVIDKAFIIQKYQVNERTARRDRDELKLKLNGKMNGGNNHV